MASPSRSSSQLYRSQAHIVRLPFPTRQSATHSTSKHVTAPSMEDTTTSQHFSRPRAPTRPLPEDDARSTVSGSYSYLCSSRRSSVQRVDSRQDSNPDKTATIEQDHIDMANSNTGKMGQRCNTIQVFAYIHAAYPSAEDMDIRFITDMLAGALGRFAGRCSDAAEKLERMQVQNAVYAAEIMDLRERIKALEAAQALPPSPPLFYTGKRQYQPQWSSSPQHDGPQHEGAFIGDGRVVRMTGGQRPRQLWTPGPGDSPLEMHTPPHRVGPERSFTYAHPLPRQRRPPSPKPRPVRGPRCSPKDAPPLPPGTPIASDTVLHRHAAGPKNSGH